MAFMAAGAAVLAVFGEYLLAAAVGVLFVVHSLQVPWTVEVFATQLRFRYFVRPAAVMPVPPSQVRVEALGTWTSVRAVNGRRVSMNFRGRQASEVRELLARSGVGSMPTTTTGSIPARNPDEAFRRQRPVVFGVLVAILMSIVGLRDFPISVAVSGGIVLGVVVWSGWRDGGWLQDLPTSRRRA